MPNWVTVNSSGWRSKGRLFCLPYAGGGAAAYYSWKSAILHDIDLVQVHLPGREARLREPFQNSIASLIDALVEKLIVWMDLPFAIYGHSMGALIAFELVRALRKHNHVLPYHLFVTGFRAPQLPPRERITGLPDEKFIQRLLEYGGIPDMIVKNLELMEIFLPIFRADFELIDNYVYRPEEPLDCPLTAFGGENDPKIFHEEIEAWREQTTCDFNCHILPGGHFFINESKPQLLKLLRHNLDKTFYMRPHTLRSMNDR